MTLRGEGSGGPSATGNVIDASRACGAVGSAPRSHRGGQEFESPQVHHKPPLARLSRSEAVFLLRALAAMSGSNIAPDAGLHHRCGAPQLRWLRVVAGQPQGPVRCEGSNSPFTVRRTQQASDRLGAKVCACEAWWPVAGYWLPQARLRRRATAGQMSRVASPAPMRRAAASALTGRSRPVPVAASWAGSTSER